MTDYRDQQLSDIEQLAYQAGCGAAMEYRANGEEAPPGLMPLPPHGPGPGSLTRALKVRLGIPQTTDPPSREELKVVHDAWVRGVRDKWRSA